MKCYQRIVALCLSMCMAISLFCVSNVEVYASTDLNMECVGSLNENFDELTDVNALYQKSGEGVLSGTWQFTELSAWGKGSNEIKPLDSGNKGLNMTATEDWAKPGGVDFMFDKPLAPEYILDISYDMHFDSSAMRQHFSAMGISIIMITRVSAAVWAQAMTVFKFSAVTRKEKRRVEHGMRVRPERLRLRAYIIWKIGHMTQRFCLMEHR